jgi:glycosyltransferase involved in cell wall biosynthesis
MTVIENTTTLFRIGNFTSAYATAPLATPSPIFPSVSVVIPTLNEARNLEHVLPRIPIWVEEVILVDGYSTDDTVTVAQALRPDIRVIYEKRKGKGVALRTGFLEARGDIVVMLDADGSTDPAEIPAFVGALLAGNDFAKGSRYLQGGGSADISLIRSLGNLVFTYLVRLTCGGSYTDLCYGYNAFWRRVLPKLELDGDGFEIETMMNMRALLLKLRVVEVPSFEGKRIHGESNLRAIPDGWRVLKTIFKEVANLRTPNLFGFSSETQREGKDWA